MNAVEQLQGQVAALSRRVVQLEELLAVRRKDGGDAAAARAVAAQLGLDGEVVERGAWSAGSVGKRRELALALNKRGWSIARIARVLACCERTAARYLAGSRGQVSGQGGNEG